MGMAIILGQFAGPRRLSAGVYAPYSINAMITLGMALA
jgi:hypothetical protein